VWCSNKSAIGGVYGGGNSLEKAAMQVKTSGGGPYKNAMVLMPEMSKRFRQRRFLQAALSSISTM